MHHHLLIAPKRTSIKMIDWLLYLCSQKKAACAISPKPISVLLKKMPSDIFMLETVPFLSSEWPGSFNYHRSSLPASAKGHDLLDYSSTSLNRWRCLCDVRSRPHMLVVYPCLRCSHAWAQASRPVFVSYSEQHAITRSRCLSVVLLAAHGLPTPASLQMWCNQHSCCQMQPVFYSPRQVWLAWLL